MVFYINYTVCEFYCSNYMCHILVYVENSIVSSVNYFLNKVTCGSCLIAFFKNYYSVTHKYITLDQTLGKLYSQGKRMKEAKKWYSSSVNKGISQKAVWLSFRHTGQSENRLKCSKFRNKCERGDRQKFRKVKRGRVTSKYWLMPWYYEYLKGDQTRQKV